MVQLATTTGQSCFFFLGAGIVVDADATLVVFADDSFIFLVRKLILPLRVEDLRALMRVIARFPCCRVVEGRSRELEQLCGLFFLALMAFKHGDCSSVA